MDDGTVSTPALDEARRTAGFRTVAEVVALAPEVLVLDPASVLLGTGATVHPGVVLHPSTTLETRDGGTIVVETGARLGPGPVTVVAHGSHVRVGGGAELGPGPVTITAYRSEVTAASVDTVVDVAIGAAARLRGGCVVEAPADIGAGAQVLGSVSLRDAVLAAGGDHREPDPDRRAGVVKGTGRVHGVRIGVGEVAVVTGGSTPPEVERQRAHHPDAPRR
ncbi:hypothetical protein BIU97_02355 [Curtobacterium sp. MCBA15_009]|uniref:hypothetical protein n=1 Tax=Curtobacterium sp. MCBA15_009 TaxID=1898737 RepID=UPI0008DDA8D6|nr:hypothetical protein [Curtobacterium sp. MCBA15_009]OII12807.1 hypothetical protein BIU97_02355 [Curtobacterium sp. MCBA15_009]